MEIKVIKTSRVISPTLMTIAPYAINPYRGCELGCLYCYVQLTKNFKRNFLGVKMNAPLILEKELKTKNVKRVVLGSSCECFTYAELKFKITEKILNILNKYRINYTILTKSTVIENYLDLIKNNQNNCIFFTFNFTSEKIKSLLEVASPSLKKRLHTLENIIKLDIKLRIHIGPFIPYFSTLEEIFLLFKNKIKNINIELYHSKMGNFKEILSKLKNFNMKLASKLEDIYRSPSSYYNFSQDLKERAQQLNKNYNYRLNFIVPEFDKFYDSKITYD